MNCDALLFNKYAYAWPRDEVLQQFEDLPTRPPDDYIENLIREAKRIRFQGVERLLEVYVSDFNPCIGSLKVQIIVSSDDALQSREADKEFSLDYFNFPVVDNTRLQNNHRLAMVIEDIDLYDEVQPYIRLAAVIFPSEYASLRDRPGMEEARKLLASALRDEPEPASASITGRRVEDGLLIKTVTRAPCEASVFSRARCNRTN